MDDFWKTQKNIFKPILNPVITAKEKGKKFVEEFKEDVRSLNENKTYYVMIKNPDGRWIQRDAVIGENAARKVASDLNEEVASHQIQTYLINPDKKYITKLEKTEKFEAHKRRLAAEKEIQGMPTSQRIETIKKNIQLKPEGIREIQQEMTTFSRGPETLPKMAVPFRWERTTEQPQGIESLRAEEQARIDMGIQHPLPPVGGFNVQTGEIIRAPQYSPITMKQSFVFIPRSKTVWQKRLESGQNYVGFQPMTVSNVNFSPMKIEYDQYGLPHKRFYHPNFIGKRW